jgi:hypothetical protein
VLQKLTEQQAIIIIIAVAGFSFYLSIVAGVALRYYVWTLVIWNEAIVSMSIMFSNYRAKWAAQRHKNAGKVETTSNPEHSNIDSKQNQQKTSRNGDRAEVKSLTASSQPIVIAADPSSSTGS